MVFLKLLWIGATVLVGGKFAEFFDDARELPGVAPPPPDQDSSSRAIESAQPRRTDDQHIASADRTLALTGTALALTAAGAVIAPWLRLASWPFLIWALAPTARDELAALRADGRVRYRALELLQASIELAMGYLGLTAGGWMVYTAGERFLLTTRRDVNRQLASALGERPEQVWLVVDGVEVQVPLARVVVGDRIAVRAGDLIPVDGCIVEGLVGVDQRALTGESRIQELAVGDPVRAATLVLSGEAIVCTEHTGPDTVAARVEALIASSSSYEQQLQARASRLADRSVSPTLLVAGYGYLTRGPVGLLGGFWTNALDIAWLSAPL